MPDTSIRATGTKPGCFGLAVTFNPKSEHCKACSCFSDCQPLAFESLESASKVIDVSDLAKQHESFGGSIKSTGGDRIGQKMRTDYVLTAGQERAIHALPLRHAGIARSIYAQIGDPIHALRRRENPFWARRPWYLEPVIDLAFSGTTRSEVKAELGRRNPEWTPGTLAVRASTAIRVLVAVGALVEINNYLRVRE